MPRFHRLVAPGRRCPFSAASSCASRPVAPGMIREGVLAQGRQLLEQLLAPGGREGRSDADVVQRPVLVVEAQEQGADHRAPAVLVPSESGDDAVGGPPVLDLEHGPFTGKVGLVEALGHDAVETGAFEAAEPVLRQGAIARRGGEVDRTRRVAEELVEFRPPLLQRRAAQILVAEREHIPRDVGRRRLRGEKLDAGLGRMNPQEQGLEVQPGRADDDDLAVQDAALRERGGERRDELGKVPVHRLLVATLEQELVPVAKDERAEPVPLRLEEPALAAGEVFRGGREHRGERRREGKRHTAILASGSGPPGQLS